jgi:hypothetical protein
MGLVLTLEVKLNEPEDMQSAQAPLHRRIAEAVSQQVIHGELQPGQRLPSERQIALEYDASRATVRTALQHLEQAGYITRRERRSAIVTIRRDITPTVRIACGSPRLLQLFHRLGELQMLPTRHQLHFVDMHQPGAFGQLLAQPSSTADVIVTELEYINCFRAARSSYHPVAKSEFTDAHISPTLSQHFSEKRQYISVPLGMSPMMLYYDRRDFSDWKIEAPGESKGVMPDLEDLIAKAAEHKEYAIQFRPAFSHLSALFLCWGSAFFGQEGQFTFTGPESLRQNLQRLYQHLHLRKTTPVLAKAEQFNLFAKRRCAMAIDGFELYHQYRETLGDDLGVAPLPQKLPGSRAASGFAAVVMPGLENNQSAIDLIRNLLSPTVQRMFVQLSGGLPIRQDLLNERSLNELNMPAQDVGTFLAELARCDALHLPSQISQKSSVENLFLELWLNLDSVDNLTRRLQNL